ncbi:MAG: polysaccharide biosynthesis C-terminal domain-containing protein, partial [Acidobacteria bacterium]|nr:polysaccharide biosynthesis C-terminal domain-containing protein [Acidobacteriota bacterium]
LLFYAIGLSAFSMMKIIVPAFYAIQDTRTPVRVAFAAMIVNIILNVIFFGPDERGTAGPIPLGVGGPALASSLSAFFNAIALMVIFRRRHGRFGIRNIVQSLGKFALGAAVLGVVASVIIGLEGFYNDQSGTQKIFALTATIAAAAGTYFAMVFLLRSRELSELREVFARRRDQRRVD